VRYAPSVARVRMTLAPLALALFVVACDRAAPAEAEESKPAAEAPALAKAKEVTLVQAATLHKEGKAVLVDCNDRASRVERGTVRGATLLKKPPKIGDELPADKDTPLLFYCWDDT
jgi:hypothetical protein